MLNIQPLLSWVTGIAGQALKLDGTSQYATVPDNASLDITSAITLAAWIKPERTATQYIIKKSIAGQSNGYELSLSSGGLVFIRFNQASSGDTYRLNSATAYPNDGNTWMHVAATFNGSVIKIYINGVENSSKTLSAPLAINTNANVLAIGAQSDGVNKFKGVLDEARVYNTALSASEISQLAGASPTSSKSPFSLLETSQQVKLQEELLAYPNPVSSKANLSFSLPVDADYTLRLYDAKGAHIQLLQQGKAKAGQSYTVEVDASRLNKGLYMARLQTTRGTKTLRLVLDK